MPTSQEDSEERLLALADEILAAAEDAAGDPELLTGAAQRLSPLFAASRSEGSEIEAPASHDAGADLIGRRISHYRVDALIGAGGMGRVYRGTDELLGRSVAIKSLLPGPDGFSLRARERLLREARALARLDHPAICRIHDLIEHREERFLVLELVDGRTLREAIRQEALSSSPSATFDVVRQIAEALGAAHAAGIVHRDLKPDNVILQADGRVKILDFGIARLIGQETSSDDADAASSDTEDPPPREQHDDESSIPEESTTAADVDSRDLTRPGLIVGTPRYMSPEQRAGRAVTSAVDLYSLGVLLEELLPDDTHSASLSRRLRTARPELRPSAVDVANELRQLLDAPRRRRRRRLFMGAGTVAIALLGSSLWNWRASTAGQREMAALPRPIRTVVLPIDNATGDAAFDWTETGLRDLVGEAIDADPGFELVSAPWIEDRPLDTRSVRAADATVVVRATLEREGETLFRLVQELALVNGRRIRRRYVAEDPVVAADALVDRLRQTLDPSGSVAEAHSGDPFLDRLYAMSRAEIARGADAGAAVTLLERVLEVEPEFHRARLALSRAHALQTDWRAGTAEVDRVLAQVDRDRQPQVWLRGIEVKIGLLAQQGRNDDVQQLLREALDTVGSLQESGGEQLSVALELRSQLALQLMEASRYEDAVEILRETESVCREAGLDEQLLATLHRLGVAYDALNLAAEGETALREALALAQQLGHERRQGMVLNNLANIYQLNERFEEALQLFEQSLAIARATGSEASKMSILGNRANLLVAMGRVAEAIPIMEEVLAWAQRIDRGPSIGIARFNLVYFACLEGRPELAERHLAGVLDYYGGEGWDVQFMVGWVDLLRGRFGTALERFEAAKDLAPASNWGEEQEALLQQAIIALREADVSGP